MRREQKTEFKSCANCDFVLKPYFLCCYDLRMNPVAENLCCRRWYRRDRRISNGVEITYIDKEPKKDEKNADL